jgi:hypothetical protein
MGTGEEGGLFLHQNLFEKMRIEKEGNLKNTNNKKLFYKNELICRECSGAIHESIVKWLERKFVRTFSTVPLPSPISKTP